MHFSYKTYFLVFSSLFCIVGCLYSVENTTITTNRVMTVDEFKQAIDNNAFLKQEAMTSQTEPLDEYEIERITLAIKNQNTQFGGEFDPGREINLFTGSTLLVGGGKSPGSHGENDGKTILINVETETQEMKNLIKNLTSGKWNKDPYIGKTFNNKAEKEAYIKILEHKLLLYKEAYNEKNKDILNRYFTLSIEKTIHPDMLGSITSNDMSKIPDNKFMKIEFENVPCDVFLNPKLYTTLERITKADGTIQLSISYNCRRLIVPIIQKTKFGEEFTQKIKTEMYRKLKNMNSAHGSFNITVRNK